MLNTTHTTPKASHPGKDAKPHQLSTMPLYLQLYKLLKEKIVNGEWPPNTVLPNESDLAHEFQISQGTMRKALDMLEADRFLSRKAGRGTTVSDFANNERERLAQCLCRAAQIADEINGLSKRAEMAVIWAYAQELFRLKGAYAFGAEHLAAARTAIEQKEAEEAKQQAAA